jgi:hypothetical protein
MLAGSGLRPRVSAMCLAIQSRMRPHNGGSPPKPMAMS